MADIFNRIVELQQNTQPFCVVTVVAATGSTPRNAGARAIIFLDGKIEGTVGGGSIEQEAIQEAIDRIQTGEPILKKYVLEALDAKMSCGGSMSLFFEPILPQNRLTIFGGGHVGRALAQAAHVAEWKIRVVDHRDFVLDRQFFPPEAELILTEYIDFIQNTTFSRSDWLVIATPKHKFDSQVLARIVNESVAYIGMLGSDKKVLQIRTELMENGIPAEVLDRVHAPIGLNIGTETPGEIAIAIVAEMLVLKNQVAKVSSFVDIKPE